jgi:hypothetical protein
MKSKILRIIQTSMLVVGVCALSGCFERQYYGGAPGYTYGSPGYAYAPAYATPYRYGRYYSYAPEYHSFYRPEYRYEGGGRAWVGHERAEHEAHERHERREHH